VTVESRGMWRRRGGGVKGSGMRSRGELVKWRRGRFGGG